jgi:hypothetical protein
MSEMGLEYALLPLDGASNFIVTTRFNEAARP